MATLPVHHDPPMWRSPVSEWDLKWLHPPDPSHTHAHTFLYTSSPVWKSVSVNILLFLFAAQMSDSHDHLASTPAREARQLHVANLGINSGGEWMNHLFFYCFQILVGSKNILKGCIIGLVLIKHTCDCVWLLHRSMFPVRLTEASQQIWNKSEDLEDSIWSEPDNLLVSFLWGISNGFPPDVRCVHSMCVCVCVCTIGLIDCSVRLLNRFLFFMMVYDVWAHKFR